jgi:hypothetical protein
MRPEELLEELHRRPFQPLRMYLTDGAVYEIHHPELVMVGRGKVLVGTPAIGQPGIFERYDAVSLLHVVRLEPTTQPPSMPASNPTEETP